MLIKTFKESIPFLTKANIASIVWGQHGIGKSQVVAQYCKENNLGFIDLRLGTQDVGDLLGLADFQTDANGNKVATKFMQPEWFPTDPDSKGIIFLDEINRARRDVIQAVFQLVLDKKLHTYHLPKGWHVIAAANPNSADYVVLDLGDKAFMDRFCHIKLTPSVGEWLDFAGDNGFDDTIVDFIKERPDMLQIMGEDFSYQEVTPSRRSWDAMNRLKKAGTPVAILQELGFGLVGMPATVAYVESLTSVEKPLTGDQIIFKYPEFRNKIKAYAEPTSARIDLLNYTCDNVQARLAKLGKGDQLLEDAQANLLTFMKDLPAESAFKLYRELFMLNDTTRAIVDGDAALKAHILKFKNKK
jgi:hypothetical protein